MYVILVPIIKRQGNLPGWIVLAENFEVQLDGGPLGIQIVVENCRASHNLGIVVLNLKEGIGSPEHIPSLTALHAGGSNEEHNNVC